MAVIAKNCPDVKVEVVDINQNRIMAWNDADLNKLPIFEPGLDELVKKNVQANSKNQTPGLGNMPVIGNLSK